MRAGRFGRALLASARVKSYRPPDYYSGSRWRGTRALDGGAALINQGIHTVDLLRWLLGPVVRVKALAATRWHEIEGEDTALALLEFASGAVATFEATTCAYPGYPRRLELTTTGGTVVVEGDAVVAADLREAVPGGLDVSPGGLDTASAASPVVSDVSAHAAVITDFAEAVRTGRAPLCNGRDGRDTLAVVEAVYAAARIHWFYDRADVDGIYQLGLTDYVLKAAAPPGMFLTVTTLIDRSKMHHGHHTCEAFVFVSYEAFNKWAHERSGEHAADYEALKEDLAWRLFQALEQRVPGISRHVVFWNLATPLTNAHYIMPREAICMALRRAAGK